jgi:hypothetical protein
MQLNSQEMISAIDSGATITIIVDQMFIMFIRYIYQCSLKGTNFTAIFIYLLLLKNLINLSLICYALLVVIKL